MTDASMPKIQSGLTGKLDSTIVRKLVKGQSAKILPNAVITPFKKVLLVGVSKIVERKRAPFR
jgi:hypothetical protein